MRRDVKAPVSFLLASLPPTRPAAAPSLISFRNISALTYMKACPTIVMQPTSPSMAICRHHHYCTAARYSKSTPRPEIHLPHHWAAKQTKYRSTNCSSSCRGHRADEPPASAEVELVGPLETPFLVRRAVFVTVAGGCSNGLRRLERRIRGY